ncbi:hypothetical protein L1887_21367 [Cichorium endivia]|nr:hypothetical protein L1887_21367 [Cichorium endivia]
MIPYALPTNITITHAAYLHQLIVGLLHLNSYKQTMQAYTPRQRIRTSKFVLIAKHLSQTYLLIILILGTKITSVTVLALLSGMRNMRRLLDCLLLRKSGLCLIIAFVAYFLLSLRLISDVVVVSVSATCGGIALGCARQPV